MATDPTTMCELLVGLDDVTVLAVDETDARVTVTVETRSRPSCPTCGGAVRSKDRSEVTLVDLGVFGRPARLVWRKHRWRCADACCPTPSWTAPNTSIADPRFRVTHRCGRWMCAQVGRHGRAVSDVATELGCDWHTVNDAVIAYGRLLVDDPERVGSPSAVGLDETLFNKTGKYRTQAWATSVVDVKAKFLMDMVQGRDSASVGAWFDLKGEVWCNLVAWATLDLSGPYRKVFNEKVPHATQVADPFHVIKLANQRVDEVRRRVQQDTLGHRGLKGDPLYRCARLLRIAAERLDDEHTDKLKGLLVAGDPKGEVQLAWHAKEVVRQIYQVPAKLAGEWVTQLGKDLQDESCPPEIRQLGRTISKWRTQISAWHQCHLSNGPTEGANNLIKRIKRVGFGFRTFANYRIRCLLYAGRPNWDLLATATPR